MAITKNIVTDYGADSTGVASVTPAFYSGLRPDMAGQDCNLTIPAGTYKFQNTGGESWATGHTSLNVTATGATLTTEVTLGARSLEPHTSIDNALGISARLQTVSAGATSVTLTAASASAGHISRAVVGRWMMVCGFPIQGLFQAAYGYPPNNNFNEYVQITGIVGNTISFTPALQNTYSSQWPEFTRGASIFEIDGGGPATAYFMHADWGAPISYTGGTYTCGNLIGCGTHDVTLTGITCDSFPVFPSLNKTYRLYDSYLPGAQVEADKNNDLVDIQGGTHSQWWWQSSSTRLFTMTGTTITGGLNGTPRNAVIDTCSIGSGLNIGPTSYGRGETFVIRNSTIAGGVGGGILEKGPGELGMQSCIFMSGGVITMPMSLNDTSTRTFVPDPSGRNVNFWSGSNGHFGYFRVLSVTADTWPAVDSQSSTTSVTIANGSTGLSVSSSIFQAGDVGKVIQIPGGGSSGTLNTFITAFTDAQNVTIFDACSSAGLSASSQTLEWGTCNIYVQTDQSGGLPSSSSYGSILRIFCPPVRSVTFESCTGTEQVVDLSQAAAQNRPLNSYTKRPYTGNLPIAASSGLRLSAAGALAGSGSLVPMLGNLISLKINVTKAYTGTQSTLTFGLGQFTSSIFQGGVAGSWNPRINMKILGERAITIGSTTGTQTGDSNLTQSVATWIPSGFNPVLSADVSGEDPSVWPQFTVEMITDQGFAPAPVAVAPLRLRLHS